MDERPDQKPSLNLGPSSSPRGRVGTLLQKLFFRDEHHREQLLLDLIDDLGRCRDEKELGQDVGRALQHALSPDRLHIFSRRGSRFRLIYSGDHPMDEAVFLPEPSELPRIATAWHEPHRARAFGQLPAADRSWLRQWGAEWLVALQFPPRRPEGLVGFIVLGKCTTPFSAVQRDLLQTLADRTAKCQVAIVKRHCQQLADREGPGQYLKECSKCLRCFDANLFYCPHDDQLLEPTLLMDRLVKQRYRIDRKLGRGGMGTVYQAQDQVTGDEVALKVLTAGDRVAQGRFANEARAGQVLRHPNITQVLDSGELGERGAFMVMEYVEGRTLRTVFDSELPLEPQRIALWFDQILDGVQTAHDQGVIHRDIKPDNIMLTVEDDGREMPKILDFGLAKLRDYSPTGTRALTAVGMVIGTLSYMSPEQLAAEKVDHRTDIFALAVMVCEALTGRPPFWAENLGKMLRAVASTPFRLDVENANQAQVADVLGRALAKTPEGRFSEVADFRRELIPALKACSPFRLADPKLNESRDAARA